MSLRIHSLRRSTEEKTAAIQATPKVSNSRHYVPLQLAATRQLPEGHDCSQVYPDMAEDKSQRRIFGLFIRYAFTYYIDCHTYRIKTDLQCGKSSCDCESAHWAITPTMRDNNMIKVINHIEEGKQLSPKKVTYLKARLPLDSPEKNVFTALQAAEQVEYIQQHIIEADRHNSFHGTHYELQLSGTLEGSIVTNDLDQLIEKPFRQIEDRYCALIEKKEKNVDEALSETLDQFTEIFQSAIKNLKLRKSQLKHYFDLETQLETIESAYVERNDVSQIEHYFSLVNELLEAKEALIQRMPYCTNFDRGRFAMIANRRDFFWLNSFVRTYDRLENDEDKEALFVEHMKSIQIKDKKTDLAQALQPTLTMLEEAKSQFNGLQEVGGCHLTRLPYWLFGIVDQDGRRAPTEEELTHQILEMTRKNQKRKRENLPVENQRLTKKSKK